MLLGLIPQTSSADERGVDPPEPSPASDLSPPARPDCRPGLLCPVGSVVRVVSVALSPADAREALLAVRLLPEVEADLSASQDREAQLAQRLAVCVGEGEEQDCPEVEPAESWGERWLGRAGWLLSGVAVGLVAGLVVVVAG
jgi:hypothetical protein